MGYKLIAEAHGPKEIVRQTVEAEHAGFDFVEVSDHFHPWLNSTGHSGFAFGMLSAAAAKTERIELVTGVTCPSFRYHPAIVAQASATQALLSDGRFTLGAGSGERLNEHIVGGGWPSVRIRHERFHEALEIIRALWSGGYQTYEGKHFTLEVARVFDLPETPPDIAVAISGPRSAKVAAELGDAYFAIEPKPELTEAYQAAGGLGPGWCEAPLSWAPDEAAAIKSAHEKFRFGLLGWKLLAELPNPENFEAASAWVTEDAIAGQFGVGPDAEQHLAAIQPFVDAGFENLTLTNAGPDPDGFLAFFATDLAERVRALTPSGPS